MTNALRYIIISLPNCSIYVIEPDLIYSPLLHSWLPESHNQMLTTGKSLHIVCDTYVCDLKELYLTLEADDGIDIKWWIDALFAVHPDMKSHMGTTMSFSKGLVYSMSESNGLTPNLNQGWNSGCQCMMACCWWSGHTTSSQHRATRSMTTWFSRIIRVLCWSVTKSHPFVTMQYYRMCQWSMLSHV